MPERLDVAGLVLLGEGLELVEDALRQGLAFLGRLVLAGRLVHAEASDPDLQLRILLQLAEDAEVVVLASTSRRQRLELAAREVDLGVPEEPVLGLEPLGNSG